MARLPIPAHSDKVNIVHYNNQLYACCKPCRDKAETDDFELVQQTTRIWTCFQCGNKTVLRDDMKSSHIAVTEQNEQIVHWVATWLRVDDERVKVSIDG